MFSNGFIALAAGIGVAIWVYQKTSYRGTGDLKKQLAPALFSAILTFLITLTLLWRFF